MIAGKFRVSFSLVFSRYFNLFNLVFPWGSPRAGVKEDFDLWTSVALVYGLFDPVGGSRHFVDRVIWPVGSFLNMFPLGGIYSDNIYDKSTVGKDSRSRAIILFCR